MMTIGMGSFWILLAVLVYALLSNGRPESTRSPGAREILQERFARGEIDAEEYQTRLDILTRTSR
ncbi:SHOCT domain-containing protein [Nocardia sp. N13]|uniref:SHOCT domain-containing protein n=1 Tax=Nocardioides sp. N13(2025) TaxID=3453405 RepID=UPI003F76DCF2